MTHIDKYQGLFKDTDGTLVVAYKSEADKDQAIKEAMKSQTLGTGYALAALLAYSKESPLQGISWDYWYILIKSTTNHVVSDGCPTVLAGVKDVADRIDAKAQNDAGYGEGVEEGQMPQLMQAWHQFFKEYEDAKASSYQKRANALAVLFAITQGLGAFFSLMFFLLPAFGVSLVPAVIISVSLGIIATWVNYDLGQELLLVALNKVSAFWQSLTRRYKDGEKVMGVKRYAVTLSIATLIVVASSATMALLFYHSVAGIAASGHASAVLTFFTHGAMAAAMPYVAISVAAIVGLVEVLFFAHAMIAILRDGGMYGVGRLFKKTFDNIKDDLKDNPHQGAVKVLAVIFFVVAVAANITGIGLMVHGTVSDLHSIAPMLDVSIRWAWATVAGVGMAFFFIKSSVGWSYDASKSVSKVPTIQWRRDVWPAVKSNGFAILGVVALISCVAVPGAGVFVGLAALSVALVFNRMVKKGITTRLANATGTGAIVMAATEGPLAVPALVSNGLSSVFNTHVSSLDDSRYVPSDAGVAMAKRVIEPEDEGVYSRDGSDVDSPRLSPTDPAMN